jgi:hypothetical protein
MNDQERYLQEQQTCERLLKNNYFPWHSGAGVNQSNLNRQLAPYGLMISIRTVGDSIWMKVVKNER